MKNLGLIIQHEYMALVGRKSFIVMTLLMPVLMVGLVLLPVLLSEINSESGAEQTVTVIDETGQMAGSLPNSDIYKFVFLSNEPGKPVKPAQFFGNAGSSVDALLVIPATVMDNTQVTLYSTGTVNQGLLGYVTEHLTDTLQNARIAAQNIPQLKQIIDNAAVDLQVNTIKLNEDGSEQRSSAAVAMVLGIILAFVTYMFILSYGAMIMNSVIEEKTNRIVEVIVSSCKPFELMMGKIIGVGLVGLTQFALWAAVMVGVTQLPILQGSDDMAAMSAVLEAVRSVDVTWIIAGFVVYFVGGYLLYASLFAGFGSAVDQASDASQFTTPIILIMVAALYCGMACMENPGGQMAVWCSIIPFTSPIVMMVRLPYDVPLWQLGLSVALLFATAAAMVWLSARIYRTGILMYGKKYTLKEIGRWMRRKA